MGKTQDRLTVWENPTNGMLCLQRSRMEPPEAIESVSAKAVHRPSGVGETALAEQRAWRRWTALHDVSIVLRN